MLVHPKFHKNGIGRKMMEAMQTVYGNFHQQLLIADDGAIEFYTSMGFIKAGKTESMWIYSGNDH